MKNSVFGSWVLGALLLGCAADTDVDSESATRTTTTLSPIQSVRLGPSQVKFEQIVFDRGGVSSWGAMTIDAVAVAKAAGMRSGFVSARMAGRWLAFNVPVTTAPDALWPARVAARRPAPSRTSPPVRVHFNLGTDRPTSALAADVLFTSRPLTAGDLAAYETQPLGTFAVRPYDQTDDLGILPAAGLPVPPDGLPPAPPPVEIDIPDVLEDHWEVSLPHESNVEAARNQCAVSAMANNLDYLRSTFGLPFLGLHIKSWGDGIGLSGHLDTLSGRVVTDNCNGNGLEMCADDDAGGIMDGLYNFIDADLGNAGVALRHQGNVDSGSANASYPQACSALPQDGPSSPFDSNKVTFEWVCDRIKNGDGVILGYLTYSEPEELGWPGEGQVPISGHAVRVYGCGETAGTRFFRTLDDNKQDKMIGEDNPVCTARAGLAWEYMAVSDVDYDGDLNVDGNYLREIAFAIAIEAL